MPLILTNMCLIYGKDNKILLQDRAKNDWPGLNLPGGHVKENETLVESVKREIKEETNLTLLDVEFVGIYEWFIKETNTRHLAILYKSNKFEGVINSNSEGIDKFYAIGELKSHTLSVDLDKILKIYNIDIN